MATMHPMQPEPARNLPQAGEGNKKAMDAWPTAYPLRDAADRILAAIRELPEVRR